jgi:RNA 3'-terminal phosphate cyclase (ATP)
LIFQTLLLPLAFGETTSQFTLRGGTHVPWSPPFEHLAHVYLPTVGRMGVRAMCRLEAWGFYPVGGGKIVADIYGVNSSDSNTEVGEHVGEPGVTGATRTLTPLVLTERGDLRCVWGTAVACNLPVHVAQRMTNRAYKMLSSAGLRAEITPRRGRGVGAGASLCLIAEYEHALAGFSALGERGKPSEQVAEEACRDLLAHHANGAPVDLHLSDQLLLPMAFAPGRSEFRVGCITRHLLTNAHIIRQFLPAQIEVEGDEGRPGTVVVRGTT